MAARRQKSIAITTLALDDPSVQEIVYLELLPQGARRAHEITSVEANTSLSKRRGSKASKKAESPSKVSKKADSPLEPPKKADPPLNNHELTGVKKATDSSTAAEIPESSSCKKRPSDDVSNEDSVKKIKMSPDAIAPLYLQTPDITQTSVQSATPEDNPVTIRAKNIKTSKHDTSAFSPRMRISPEQSSINKQKNVKIRMSSLSPQRESDKSASPTTSRPKVKSSEQKNVSNVLDTVDTGLNKVVANQPNAESASSSKAISSEKPKSPMHKAKKDSKPDNKNETQPRPKSPVKISSPKAVHEVSIGQPKKLSESIVTNNANVESKSDAKSKSKTSREDQESESKGDSDIWSQRLGQLTDQGFVQKVMPKEKVIICPPENLAWVKDGKAVLSSEVRKGINNLVSKGCSAVYLQLSGHDQYYKVYTKTKPFKLLPVPKSSLREVHTEAKSGGEAGSGASVAESREGGGGGGDSSSATEGSSSEMAEVSSTPADEAGPRRQDVPSPALSASVPETAVSSTHETTVDLTVSTKNSKGSPSNKNSVGKSSKTPRTESTSKTIPKKTPKPGYTSKASPKKVIEPETISEAPTVSTTPAITGIPATLSPPTASVEPDEVFSLDRPMKEWGIQDVHRWLEDNNLATALPYFQDVDGTGMAEMVHTYTESSNPIMDYLKEMGVKFQDILKLCALLRAFPKNKL